MNQEHYLLEHWGICDFKDFINGWVDELKNGVRTASGVMDVCKYDTHFSSTVIVDTLISRGRI